MPRSTRSIVLRPSRSRVVSRSMETPRRMLPRGFLISCATCAAACPTAASDSVFLTCASASAASVTSTSVTSCPCSPSIARGDGGFEHHHRFGRSELVVDGCAHGRPWKDFEEGGVGAAYVIVRVDGDDGADHAFEHLRTETPFALRFAHALAQLTETTLHFPDRSQRDDDADQDGDRAPQSDRA